MGLMGRMAIRWVLTLILAILLNAGSLQAQSGLASYDQFEIKQDELIWRNTYVYRGDPDSVRHAVVQMLKSKFFTFNVIRNEIGYNGELRNYVVDCKKYNRTYLNTPRMYWDGEWTGKFTVEVNRDSYRVTVYALYYEKMTQNAGGYYRTEKLVKGRFIDAVTVKDKKSFRKNELSNISLMGLSLMNDFDVKNTTQLK